MPTHANKPVLRSASIHHITGRSSGAASHCSVKAKPASVAAKASRTPRRRLAAPRHGAAANGSGADEAAPRSMRHSPRCQPSHGAALMFAFASPTGYNLGKSGWVTASFGKKDKVPLGLLQAWIDESYRAIAPKALVKTLAGA